MNYCVLDLEMNQPSGAIIQIGAVCYDTRRGVTSSFTVDVNPHEQLTEFITELTGITQADVDKADPLPLAYTALVEWAEKAGCQANMATWGTDYWTLKTQVAPQYWVWRRFLNVKEVATLLRAHDSGKARGGLSASLDYFGLKFLGTPHTAVADAYNTARLLAVVGLEHKLWVTSRRLNGLDNI